MFFNIYPKFYTSLSAPLTFPRTSIAMLDGVLATVIVQARYRLVIPLVLLNVLQPAV